MIYTALPETHRHPDHKRLHIIIPKAGIYARESGTHERNMPKQHKSSSSKNGIRLYLISSPTATTSRADALVDIRPLGTCPPLRNRPECNRLYHQLHSSIHSAPSPVHGLGGRTWPWGVGQRLLRDTPKPVNKHHWTMACWVSALENRSGHRAAASSKADSLTGVRAHVGDSRTQAVIFPGFVPEASCTKP